MQNSGEERPHSRSNVRYNTFTLLSGLALTTALIAALATSVVPVAAQDPKPLSDPAEVAAAPIDPQRVEALEARVKQLEAQIVELRTMIGTVNSFAPGRQQGPANPMGASGTAGPLPWQGNVSRDEPLRGSLDDSGGHSSINDQIERRKARNIPTAPQGSSLDQAGDDELIARAPLDPQPPQPSPSGGAKSLYKDAYSHMLRRDYALAEKAFGSLVKKHPRSRMAGNAQYWMGETFYVRGKYRTAADAFLKSYQNYPNSVKAPDSLLKLALSLSKLRQKGAACKTYDELQSKYPNAPSHVKQRADMEQRRAGCN